MDRKVPKFKLTNSWGDLWVIAKNVGSEDQEMRRAAQIEWK